MRAGGDARGTWGGRANEAAARRGRGAPRSGWILLRRRWRCWDGEGGRPRCAAGLWLAGSRSSARSSRATGAAAAAGVAAGSLEMPKRKVKAGGSERSRRAGMDGGVRGQGSARSGRAAGSGAAGDTCGRHLPLVPGGSADRGGGWERGRLRGARRAWRSGSGGGKGRPGGGERPGPGPPPDAPCVLQVTVADGDAPEEVRSGQGGGAGGAAPGPPAPHALLCVSPSPSVSLPARSPSGDRRGSPR